MGVDFGQMVRRCSGHFAQLVVHQLVEGLDALLHQLLLFLQIAFEGFDQLDRLEFGVIDLGQHQGPFAGQVTGSRGTGCPGCRLDGHHLPQLFVVGRHIVLSLEYRGDLVARLQVQVHRMREIAHKAPVHIQGAQLVAVFFVQVGRYHQGVATDGLVLGFGFYALELARR